MDDYDYRRLLDVGDDIIHIDWDTAISREDLITFAEMAKADRDRVLVAPVPVYPDSRAGLPAMVWNLKRYLPGEQSTRYVEVGEAAHLFGFGMLYLPVALVHAFVDQLVDGGRFGDMAFASWHYRHVAAEVAVAWQVRPVHLHYRIGDVI